MRVPSNHTLLNVSKYKEVWNILIPIWGLSIPSDVIIYLIWSLPSWFVMQGQCFFGVFISCASIPCHFTSFQSVHSWHRVQTLSQSGSYKSDVVDEWPNIDFLCRLIIMFLTWCHRCKVSHSVEGNAVVYCITFNRDHLYRHHKVLFTCFLFCIANAIYLMGVSIF